MTQARRTRFRYVIGLAVVMGLYHLADDQTVVGATAARPSAAAAVAAGALHSTDGNCDQECGPSVSCEQGCWAWADQLPSFHTTCGEYGGSPWNGTGQCLGYCGDYFCNSYNGEEYGAEGCPQDCGMCGDEVCDPSNGENSISCYVDCRWCGDGICDAELNENCNTCAHDCNPNHVECGGGDPGDSCDEGKFYNGSGYCCLPEYADTNPSLCGYCTGSQQCITGWNSFLGQYVYMCLEEGEGCGSAPVKPAEESFSCTVDWGLVSLPKPARFSQGR